MKEQGTNEAEAWPRVEAVLGAALQAAAADRDAVLDQLCAGDPALRREVASLLGTVPDHDFLEASAESFATAYLSEVPDWPNGENPGAVIGRYRLVAEIGRGGMGTVWLAERADGQFEQKVALKLIKRGMDSDEILSRFLRERQILARLEHPNIARLLDGGVSDDGRPYFVMEHVAGEPITHHCDQTQLSIDARLQLFDAVCRAVQYAHQHLVVHRDIKPSNVLVTATGDVKLLDFGVAKLLGDADAQDTGRAPGDLNLITPEYASPEQAAGQLVTTASDVFQLGALLSELLTGRRHAPDRVPSSRVMRREEQPRRDGTADILDPTHIAARRGIAPERLRRRIRGDLDLIMQTATQDEPRMRYASAVGMADDIARHLSHRPVLAGERPWFYRSARFIRRYRFRLTAVASVTLLAAVAATAYVIRIQAARDRARHEAAKASESATLLRRFFQGWSPNAANRGDVSTKDLLRDAQRRAQIELAAEPGMLAAVLSMLGDAHTSVGLTAQAESLFARALAIQDGGSAATIDLAATLTRQGNLFERSARFQEAAQVFRRALRVYERMPDARQAEILAVQLGLARALHPLGRVAEAEAVLRDGLQRLGEDATPMAAEFAAELGYVLFQQARHQEASVIAAKALEQHGRLFGRSHPSTLRATRILAAALRDQGLLEQSERLYRDALSMSTSMYGARHLETYGVSAGLAILLERQGRFVEAEPFARHAASIASEVYGEHNLLTAKTKSSLAAVLLAQGKLGESEAILRSALAGIRLNAVGVDLDEGDVLNRLTHVAILRDAPDANDLYRAAAAFELARRPDSPRFATDGYEYLGNAALAMGDRALAARMYRLALSLYELQLPKGHPYRVQAEDGLKQAMSQ